MRREAIVAAWGDSGGAVAARNKEGGAGAVGEGEGQSRGMLR